MRALFEDNPALFEETLGDDVFESSADEALPPRYKSAMRRALLLPLIALALAGCPSRQRHVVSPPAEPEPGLEVKREILEVPLEDGQVAQVGADLVRPTHRGGPLPAVVFVPGAGRVSRRGTQRGDGARTYDEPIDVTAAWVRAAALQGFLALTFDKRTCGPSDDPLCRKNPSTDLDEKGPLALAQDIDAACARVEEEPGFDGRIVLFAHGQGVGPALASFCAKRAAALVLIAPIPARIDEVMVEALRHREQRLRKAAGRRAGTPAAEACLIRANQLRNAAASLEHTFRAMEEGAFDASARVQGVPLSFWKGWVELTRRTRSLLEEIGAPRVVVLGGDDLQFAPKHRRQIRAFGELPGVFFLPIEGADHHLLHDGKLRAATEDAVLGALEQALAGSLPTG